MDIQFTYSMYLWLLIAIPLLIFSHFVLLHYNQYKALKFANFYALKRVTGKRIITKNYTILVLRCLALGFLILALSQPVLRYTSKIGGYDYVIAIDVSASMAAADFPPSRLEVAKSSARGFVEKLPLGSKVGLVTFSGSTFVLSPLETNILVLEKTVNDIDIMKEGGTDIPGALIASTNLFTTKEGKAIILLTDGSNTIGTFLEDSIKEATAYVAKNNVRVYTIGIGSESGPIGYLPEYYNISATYNEKTLETIANQTDGLYLYAKNYENLTDAYSDILKKNTEGLAELELAFGLVAAAILLLFVEWGLINTRFRRFP